MDPSLVVTALTIAPGLIKYLDNKREELHGIEELDGYQQRFVRSFEASLKKELDEKVDVDDIVSKFESNREEILASLGNEHVVDVTTIVDKVKEQLTTFVVEEIDSSTVDKDGIHVAVERSYYDTLDNLSKDIREGDRPRLNNELNRVIQKDIEEIEDTLEEIKNTLRDDPNPQNRHEPFRVERDQGGMESLITEKVSRRLDHKGEFHEPPGFKSQNNQQFVLIYGRKGSGKTRVLNESVRRLIGDHEFDAVIYLDRSFRKIRNLGSLLELQYTNDVLLIWDDTHDIGDRDVIEGTLLRLNDHLNECGDNDLWVRMTARREDLDEVLKPSQHPDSIQSEIYESNLTANDTDLGMLPVDTNDNFDEETIKKLVETSLYVNNISDPQNLSGKFASAVLEYEPTPAYIESACQTISDSTGSLEKHHIDSLPDSTLGSWKKAYAELRNSSQYGESRRSILKSVAILDWINADVYALPIVQEVCQNVFKTETEFNADLQYLESRGWVNIQDSPDRIEIHDIRLEAVDTPTDDTQIIQGVSETLRKMAEGDFDLPKEVSDDYASTLISSFAQQMQDLGETDLAEEQFELAARTAEATPDVHNAYAEFLHEEGRLEEARIQRQAAKMMTTSDSRQSSAFKQLQKQIENSLSSWGTDEDNTKIRNEQTKAMLQEDTTATTADFTQEAYSKSTSKEPRQKVPSKEERARAHAAHERQQYRKQIKALKQTFHSESYQSADPPANLFRQLRREDFDTADELLTHIRTSDTPSGVITDVIKVNDLVFHSLSEPNELRKPRVKQSKEVCYQQVLQEEFNYDERYSSDSTDHLCTLVEIDTGRNKWLLFMDAQSTTDVLNMSVEEAKGIMRKEIGSDPIFDQLEAKFIDQYCHVIQIPGTGKDELIIGGGSEPQTPPLVETTKVYPQPSSKESATDSSIATRAMVKEVRAATQSIEDGGLPGSPGGVLLPTGEEANRVRLCGRIVEGEMINDEYWWTKLQGVFGESILLFAGDYERRGQEDVSPEFPVVVTGVPIPTEFDSSEMDVAIELRDISNVSLRNCWLTAVEIGEHTLDRIKRFNEDPGLSELSRQQYNIETASDLDQFKETAETYTKLI